MNDVTFQDNYSRGCQSCQQGRWFCIFLTYLCNSKCSFCPAPFKQQDKIVSAFGRDPSTIVKYLKNYPFNGISFSGGECFLVYDRLLEWLSYFKRELPDFYYWVYTNGLSADEKKMQQLSRRRLDEIRFNIAATDYNSPQILSVIRTATRLFPAVAIEIPSIPNDYHKVIDVLPYFDSIGVMYLNLHEYILVPDDPNVKTASSDIFILNKHTKIKYDINSIKNTEQIKQFCQNRRLKIKINNCSLIKKDNQMKHRRIMMGSILKKEYEQLTRDGFFVTYFVSPTQLPISELKKHLKNKDDLRQLTRHFRHPNDLKKSHLRKGTVVKLTFLPPLQVDGKRVLYRMESPKEEM
jgi:pyruvate formate-lyase activating enzyme-like uncharacterized protein